MNRCSIFSIQGNGECSRWVIDYIERSPGVKKRKINVRTIKVWVLDFWELSEKTINFSCVSKLFYARHAIKPTCLHTAE